MMILSFYGMQDAVHQNGEAIDEQENSTDERRQGQKLNGSGDYTDQDQAEGGKASTSSTNEPRKTAVMVERMGVRLFMQ
ncbi:hypothetical protein HB780_19880 [Rhizobium lusitanum]|uniref:hypothetical protein n=1 Tax=Rhizobium lusitanum TaxID=293958 RepID=UPI00160F8AD7|nr:hypothetical protein [Rhizobium lusitanum]QND47916.1 hypothetical protein HB780_19880 [Rhizobium lusitanum]